jgi:hypothetical protein
MTDQGINGTFQQTFRDEAVESADDDPEFQSFGFKFSFKELRHDDLPIYGLTRINWIRALTKSFLQNRSEIIFNAQKK